MGRQEKGCWGPKLPGGPSLLRAEQEGLFGPRNSLRALSSPLHIHFCLSQSQDLSVAHEAPDLASFLTTVSATFVVGGGDGTGV
jgi:hypothetical protein